VNAKLARHARVAFYGEDGDALLHPPGLLGTLRTMPPGELAPSARDWLTFWRHQGRRPWLGVEWRRRLLRVRNARAFDHGPFSWMRQGSPDRPARFPERHAGRPRWPLLRGATWSDLHELVDPQFTGIPVETRWPFLDQRLLAFVATLPSVPYLQQKWILRQAVDGILPDAVLGRPKTTVAGYDSARAGQLRAAGFPRRRWTAVTRTFVDVDALEREFHHGMAQSVVASLRVIALDDWCARNA
jgi:asparagine synthase (glutamine-hydrolysing)